MVDTELPATQQARAFADDLHSMAAGERDDVRAMMETAAAMIEVSADLIDSQVVLIAELGRGGER